MAPLIAGEGIVFPFDESTNNVQPQEERISQSTNSRNNGSQAKPVIYINPNIFSRNRTIQQMYGYDQQKVEKLWQAHQNEASHITKKSMNSLSPENLSNASSYSRKRKFSELNKELGSDLAGILKKQSKYVEQENDNSLNYSDKYSSESETDNYSQNCNWMQKTSKHVSFYNKYSDSYKSRSEISNKFMKNTRIKNERFVNAISSSKKRLRKSKHKSQTLLVNNLNLNTSRKWLKTIFQRYGMVRDLGIMRYSHTNKATGVIEFENQSDAERVFALCHNRIIDGAMIDVQFYHNSLDSFPDRLDSSISEFGKDYESRVTGKVSRYKNYRRNRRPRPYSSKYFEALYGYFIAKN